MQSAVSSRGQNRAGGTSRLVFRNWESMMGNSALRHHLAKAELHCNGGCASKVPALSCPQRGSQMGVYCLHFSSGAGLLF